MDEIVVECMRYLGRLVCRLTVGVAECLESRKSSLGWVRGFACGWEVVLSYARRLPPFSWEVRHGA